LDGEVVVDGEGFQHRTMRSHFQSLPDYPKAAHRERLQVAARSRVATVVNVGQPTHESLQILALATDRKNLLLEIRKFGFGMRDRLKGRFFGSLKIRVGKISAG
jgi:hypothetical protein